MALCLLLAKPAFTEKSCSWSKNEATQEWAMSYCVSLLVPHAVRNVDPWWINMTVQWEDHLLFSLSVVSDFTQPHEL